jgi:hypothetical protein
MTTGQSEMVRRLIQVQLPALCDKFVTHHNLIRDITPVANLQHTILHCWPVHSTKVGELKVTLSTHYLYSQIKYNIRCWANDRQEQVQKYLGAHMSIFG